LTEGYEYGSFHFLEPSFLHNYTDSTFTMWDAIPFIPPLFLLEQEPEAATVHAFFSPDHDHVDMMASGLIEFPGGIGLTFDCGMWAEYRNTFEILGTQGRIEIPYAYSYETPEEAYFLVKVKGELHTVESEPVNHYVLQIDDFGTAVLEGKACRFSFEDAVANMRVLDACLQSAEKRSRVIL
ncbi:Gfo/Idh/MocA family oxidoreductase, partial [Paenibacillus larvae]